MGGCTAGFRQHAGCWQGQWLPEARSQHRRAARCPRGCMSRPSMSGWTRPRRRCCWGRTPRRSPRSPGRTGTLRGCRGSSRSCCGRGRPTAHRAHVSARAGGRVTPCNMNGVSPAPRYLLRLRVRCCASRGFPKGSAASSAPHGPVYPGDLAQLCRTAPCASALPASQPAVQAQAGTPACARRAPGAASRGAP